MILTRNGNKKYLINNRNLLDYFPAHDYYIEMFFGAGSVFFNKPKANYNLLNDLDGEVYNLFNVVRNSYKEFRRRLDCLPVSSELFSHWKNNTENDPIWRAIRFIFLSNFSLYSRQDTMKLGISNTKEITLTSLYKTYKYIINDVHLSNYDFRELLNKIALRHAVVDKQRMFIYADPPYETANNKKCYGLEWNEQDTRDLFKVLTSYGSKFAISNFDSELVLKLVEEYGLNVHYLGERQNLCNRRIEVLITNYTITQQNLFNNN